MNMEEALYELGVSEDKLSFEQKSFLDENGYLPLSGILTEEQVKAIALRLDELAELEGDEAGKEVQQETGTVRLSDLVNKDPMFDISFTHSQVLAAIAHVLGTHFKLSSLNSRFAVPGYGRQTLHVDGKKAASPGDYYVCNSIWLLDDFNSDNGATRIVPGSHRSGKLPIDAMDDPMNTHPDEIQLIAPAGTVVIFNSHTWHGGAQNESDAPRRAMHAYFCRRNQPQQTDQRKYILPQTYERLSDSARFILDV